MKRDEIRRVLTTLVDRIELDPGTRDLRVRYKTPLTGVNLASPRGGGSSLSYLAEP